MVRRKPSEVPNVFNFASFPNCGGLGALGKDADNEVRRWFKLLAEIEHSQMPTENEICRQTRLAQAEQEGIKRRIRRTAEVYKKQSKTNAMKVQR
jgi:hypothetical protein